MASSLVKVLRGGQRASSLLEKSSVGAVSSAQRDLHTSQPVQGTLTMPERLVAIPEAEVSVSEIMRSHLTILFLESRLF